MDIHSFIAGTPLHVMISLSLIRQLNPEGKVRLKIVDYFAGAKSVAERISDLDWQYSDVEVSFFRTHRAAYLNCVADRTTHLYLDSDASFQRYIDLVSIKLIRPKIALNVFEDGVGSYRPDLYAGLKKHLFEMIGVGTFLGGSPFTDTMFVYEDDRYRSTFPQARCRVVRIKESLPETIERLQAELDYIFGHNSSTITPANDKCSIYLSGWSIDHGVIERIVKLDGDRFLKLHPHIKQIQPFPGIASLNNRVPAEILISSLAKRYGQIDVYHHGSSVEQYICSSHVRFIRI